MEQPPRKTLRVHLGVELLLSSLNVFFYLTGVVLQPGGICDYYRCQTPGVWLLFITIFLQFLATLLWVFDEACN